MHIRKKTSTFFWKKIDFIYQLRHYLCARWEFTHKRVYRWWLNEVAQPCFQKRCEYYGVPTNFVSEWGERRHRSPYCWRGQRSMRSDCRTRVAHTQARNIFFLQKVIICLFSLFFSLFSTTLTRAIYYPPATLPLLTTVDIRLIYGTYTVDTLYISIGIP